MEAIQKIISYFEFPFVRYALLVTIFISICAALVGTTLVLKRLSNIGDGLSHVAFGAMSIGIIINVTNNMLVTLPLTFIVAFLLLKSTHSKKVKGDSLVAMISVFSLALAYFLLNVFSTSSNLAGDVCATLFGSTKILTLSLSDVILSIVLCAITLVIYIIFFNKIYVVTFDENFSRAVGVKTKLYDVVISLTISLIVVIAINLVGSLLVTALLIFPAMSAMRVFKNYKSVIISSAIISLICAVLGLLLSIGFSTPVGSTIVLVDAVCFVGFFVIGKLRGNR